MHSKLLLPQRDKLQSAEHVWTPLPGSQALALDTRANVTLYTGSRGPGKALPLDTPVPTPYGWCNHGDLRVGNYVFGSDGNATQIVATHAVQQRDAYTLCFDDGSTLTASDDHLWTVSYDYGVARSWRTVTTAELAARAANGYKTQFPARPVVDYASRQLECDPYMFGAWLGDGSAYTRVRQPTGNRTKPRNGYVVEFGSNDAELITAAVADGYTVRRTVNGFTWLLGKLRHRMMLQRLGLFEAKSDSKFIPGSVLTSDTATRLAVLQGLCDTDGTATATGGARFSSTSRILGEDVVSLVRSLGGRATINSSTPKAHQRAKLIQYYVQFKLRDACPFRLPRKVARYKTTSERAGWFAPKLISVEYAGKQAVSCIQVTAADGLYVAGADYTVTHNTDAQLMRFRSRVGTGYGAYWRGVIFDREYKNLDDIVVKSRRWFNAFNDGAKFLESNAQYKWVWPTGEELLFRALDKDSDYFKYHGQEFPFIGWNELTKFATRVLFEKMMSCNRSSWTQEKNSLKDDAGNYITAPIPLEVFATTNPSGPGHLWVKQRFIDVAQYGQIVRTTSHVFDPAQRKNVDVTLSQVALFGSYRENKYLDVKYVAMLDGITDVNLRKAWLGGNWDVVSGGALDDVWHRSIHVIPRFTVPSSWHLDRSMDWGSTHPFSVGWWAEANGEAATLPDGRTFCPQPGSFIQLAELYGSDAMGTNSGLRMSATDLALLVVAKEKALRGNGWIASAPWPGPADNQIRDVRESDVDSIEAKMQAVGISWTASDKSPGSRRNGLQLMRDRLQASRRGEGPGLYFMDNCRASVGLIPTLPRDDDKPDDVDTTAEDHSYDMARYRILAGNRKLARKLNVGFG